MKRIAILVIASTSRPIYVHYIKTYWAALIQHLNATRPHIDVFLLFENSTNLKPFGDLRRHIIQDPCSDLGTLCSPQFHNPNVPGILSKTIHAFELLQDRYDVFFRTNLSSMIRVPYFDRFVQDKPDIMYSGGAVYRDELRDNLVFHDLVGPAKSIPSLDALNEYPGNTFVSGAGFFLSAGEVKFLLQRKHHLRYDIVDDVSIGLMFPHHEELPGFRVTVTQPESIAGIKSRIRRSNAPHVRLENFSLQKAKDWWEHIQHGELWQVEAPQDTGHTRYRIHFPLVDHAELRANEVRMTHEGLSAHPQVSLVNDPESADYVVLCHNHITNHCPIHAIFRPLKDQYKTKTIMLDFEDSADLVYDRDDFRWVLYFKRSCVDRRTNRPFDYGPLRIIPTNYGVLNDMVAPPEGGDEQRNIAISCLFEDAVCVYDWFRLGRGRLLPFAKSFAERYAYPMQIGLVSPCGPEGRAGIDERYKRCLFDSKIILHANPDPWEGDARTWEAISSGALVFVDRMCQPIPHPLVDGVHVIFYDLSEAGFEELERKIIYYLEHEEERARIGRQGRDFVLARHRSINRINEVIWELESRDADVVELRAIVDQERTAWLQKHRTPVVSAWHTPGFLGQE